MNLVVVPLIRLTIASESTEFISFFDNKLNIMLSSSDAFIYERINLWKGEGSFDLSIDYYSRRVSGWEPFIEPWTSNCSWTFPSVDNTIRLDISCRFFCYECILELDCIHQLSLATAMRSAADVLDITVTPSLLETIESVRGIFDKIPGAFACGIQDLPYTKDHLCLLICDSINYSSLERMVIIE